MVGSDGDTGLGHPGPGDDHLVDGRALIGLLGQGGRRAAQHRSGEQHGPGNGARPVKDAVFVMTIPNLLTEAKLERSVYRGKSRKAVCVDAI